MMRTSGRRTRNPIRYEDQDADVASAMNALANVASDSKLVATKNTRRRSRSSSSSSSKRKVQKKPTAKPSTGGKKKEYKRACDICEIVLMSYNSWKYHTEKNVCVRAAQKKADGPPKPRTWACTLCNKSDFKSGKALQYHITKQVCLRAKTKTKDKVPQNGKIADATANSVAATGAAEDAIDDSTSDDDDNDDDAVSVASDVVVCVSTTRSTRSTRSTRGTRSSSAASRDVNIVDDDIPPSPSRASFVACAARGGFTKWHCTLCEVDFNSRNAWKYHTSNNVCKRQKETARVRAASIASIASAASSSTPKPRAKKVLLCELCGKIDFNSRQSHRYHVDNKVCERKKEPENDHDNSIPVTQRECPLCNRRGFKSSLGLKYHIAKKVCENEAKRKAGKAAERIAIDQRKVAREEAKRERDQAKKGQAEELLANVTKRKDAKISAKSGGGGGGLWEKLAGGVSGKQVSPKRAKQGLELRRKEVDRDGEQQQQQQQQQALSEDEEGEDSVSSISRAKVSANKGGGGATRGKGNVKGAGMKRKQQRKVVVGPLLCPMCNISFKSELGLAYHVEHKVCDTRVQQKRARERKKQKAENKRRAQEEAYLMRMSNKRKRTAMVPAGQRPSLLGPKALSGACANLDIRKAFVPSRGHKRKRKKTYTTGATEGAGSAFQIQLSALKEKNDASSGIERPSAANPKVLVGLSQRRTETVKIKYKNRSNGSIGVIVTGGEETAVEALQGAQLPRSPWDPYSTFASASAASIKNRSRVSELPWLSAVRNDAVLNVDGRVWALAVHPGRVAGGVHGGGVGSDTYVAVGVSPALTTEGAGEENVEEDDDVARMDVDSDTSNDNTNTENKNGSSHSRRKKSSNKKDVNACGQIQLWRVPGGDRVNRTGNMSQQGEGNGVTVPVLVDVFEHDAHNVWDIAWHPTPTVVMAENSSNSSSTGGVAGVLGVLACAMSDGSVRVLALANVYGASSGDGDGSAAAGAPSFTRRNIDHVTVYRSDVSERGIGSSARKIAWNNVGSYSLLAAAQDDGGITVFDLTTLLRKGNKQKEDEEEEEEELVKVMPILPRALQGSSMNANMVRVRNGMRALCWSADYAHMLAGVDVNGTVSICDVRSPAAPVRVLPLPEFVVPAVEVGTNSFTPHTSVLTPSTDEATSLVWPQGSDYVVIGMASGIMCLVQLRDDLARAFPAHRRGVSALVANHKSDTASPYVLLASCSNEGSVCVHVCERVVSNMRLKRNSKECDDSDDNASSTDVKLVSTLVNEYDASRMGQTLHLDSLAASNQIGVNGKGKLVVQLIPPHAQGRFHAMMDGRIAEDWAVIEPDGRALKAISWGAGFNHSRQANTCWLAWGGLAGVVRVSEMVPTKYNSNNNNKIEYKKQASSGKMYNSDSSDDDEDDEDDVEEEEDDDNGDEYQETIV